MPQTSLGTDDLFFDGLIRGYVEENPRFLRRDWLAEKLAEKLREPGKQFVLLTAEPGAGKSAFLAQLACDHPDWPRYFIRRDQREVLADVSARSLLLRIGYQLAAKRPELFTEEQLRLSIKQRIGEIASQGEAIGVEVGKLIASPFYQKLKVLAIDQHVQRARGKVVAVRVEELYVEERLLPADDLLYLALIDPARALQRIDPTHRIIILIDALDEIRYHPTPASILTWLTNCPDLPENIRLVLSSRPPDEALNLFRAKQAASLAEMAIVRDDPHVQQDINRFVASLVAEPTLARRLPQTEGGADAFAKKAADKAHGNLGYLDALARGIDQSLARKDARTLKALLGLDELPADLEGLYGFFLHQIKQGVEGQQIVGTDASGRTYSTDVWPAAYEPILSVLAVAMEPLEVERIAALGEIAVDLKWVRPALNRLRQFLDVLDGRFRFYHATVAEFLTAEKTSTNTETADLYQNAQRWHRKIVEHFWTQFSTDWSSCTDAYALRNLGRHLRAIADNERLQRLICNGWMQACRSEGEKAFTGFADDVALAWQSETRQEIPSIETLVRLHAARLLVDEQASAYEDAYLEALVWVDRVGESIALARCRSDPKERLRGFLTVYRSLTDRHGSVAPLRREPAWRDRTMASVRKDLDRTARSIEDSLDRAAAFSEIGASLVKSGVREGNRFFNEAQEIVEALGDGGGRMRGFRALAIFLADAGDRRAGMFFSRAAEAAYAARDSGTCLQQLAEDLARPGLNGRIKEFIRIVKRLKSAHDKDHVLGWVSQALIALRRFDEAEKLTSAIGDIGERVEASCSLARALSASDPGRAIRLLGNAAAVAATDANSIRRAYGLGSLATELSKLNDPSADELFTASENAANDPRMPSFNRALARSHVVVNLVKGGRHDRAKELAASIRNSQLRMEMDERLVDAMADAGRYDEAERIAQSIPHRDASDAALSRLSGSLIRAGQFERAQNVIMSIGQTIGQQQRAVGELIDALARDGQVDRAIGLARSMPMGKARAAVLVSLVTVLAKAADRRAQELVLLAGEATIESPMGEAMWGRDEALRELTAGLTRLEQYAQAEEIARQIAGAVAKRSAFVVLAQALRKVDETRADDLLAEAEELLKEPISPRYAQFLHDISVDAGRDLVNYNIRRRAATRLREFSQALGEAGEFGRARRLALSIEDPEEKAAALGCLAAVLARASSPDNYDVIADARAEARLISDEVRRAEWFVRLTTDLAATAHGVDDATVDEAVQFVRQITDPGARVRMMCDVAVSCLPWNRERAHELCSEAWTLALAIQGESRESAFAPVAVAFARAEDYKEANKIIAQIQGAGTRAQAQADLAVRLAQAGDLEIAQETAVQIPAGYERARAICSVAAGFVRAKRPEAGELVGQAERMANEIPDKELRSSVLAELASNLSGLGLLVRAARLIEAIQTAETRNRALSGLADAHARDGAVREALMTVAMRSVDTRAGVARPLDEFVGVISRWVDGLERAKRGLPLAALAEAVQVAAWIRPDWARICRIVPGTAGKRDSHC